MDVVERVPQAVVDHRVDRSCRRPCAALRARACSRYGQLLIDSMPPATAMSMSPSAMPCAASITALRPEPHTLLIVSAPTLLSRPPLSAAWRAGAWPSAGADDVAQDALVDGGRVDAGAAHGFAHGHRAELGRLEILQPAEELAGRRANGADDDGFTHDDLDRTRPVHPQMTMPWLRRLVAVDDESLTTSGPSRCRRRSAITGRARRSPGATRPSARARAATPSSRHVGRRRARQRRPGGNLPGERDLGGASSADRRAACASARDGSGVE